MSRRQSALARTGIFVCLVLAVLIGYRVWMALAANAPGVRPAEIVGERLSPSAMVTPLSGGDAHPLSNEVIGPTVINFFGSWCAPCQAENPVLLELQAEGVRMVGVAVRDEPAATQAFLDDRGNPFFSVMTDPTSTTLAALHLGPDVPQTLVVAADGEVLFHHSGPLLGTDGTEAVERIRELAGPR